MDLRKWIPSVYTRSIKSALLVVAVMLSAQASLAAMPGPPTLVNRQLFHPGAKFGSYTVAGNNTGNDWPAFLVALKAGDVEVQAGKYRFDPISTGGFTPPLGRKILCDNPNLPPNPNAGGNNPPVVFNFPQKLTGMTVFLEFGGTAPTNPGEMYGCEFEGYHFPNMTWSGGSYQAVISVVGNYTANYFNAYGNGFDGWDGYSGVFLWGQANGSHSSPSNADVSYNRADACGGRFAEVDWGLNIKIDNNDLTDCALEPEGYAYNETPRMTVLEDSNTITYVNGPGGGASSADQSYTFGSNGVGATCHTASNGWPCSKGEVQDYSGNTFSNNVLSSTGSKTIYMAEAFQCPGSGDQSDPVVNGVYRSNTCGRGCKVICAPGNSAANSWGPGSNQ